MQKLGQVREYYRIGEKQKVREQQERAGQVQRLSQTQCVRMMNTAYGDADDKDRFKESC